MKKPLLIQNQKFEKTGLASVALETGEYRECTFNQCDFSNADFTDCIFSDCEFTGCNASLCKLTRTGFREVRFKNCKLLGLHWEDCNSLIFNLSFDHCTLDFSSFYNLNLRETVFRHSSLKESDFTDADLSRAVFESCDLDRTIFYHTNLEKADFRSARFFTIDPEQNRLRGAKFSAGGLPGLLKKYGLEIDGE